GAPHGDAAVRGLGLEHLERRGHGEDPEGRSRQVPRADDPRYQLPSRLCGWPAVRAEHQRDRRLLRPFAHRERDRRWTARPTRPTSRPPTSPTPRGTGPVGGSLPPSTRSTSPIRSTWHSPWPGAATRPASPSCAAHPTL